MANYGLYKKPYIKLANSGDYCYCCVKKECAQGQKDAYDVMHDHLKRLEDKPVFYIRRSGVDTCICLDCFKEVYENIVALELPAEEPAVKTEEPAKEAVKEEPTESKKSTKKSK